MGNAFDTAQVDIEQQRRDAIAAIAAGGSAGAKAFSEGQAQIEASRNAAMNTALAEAASRGQGNIAGVLSGVVNSPYMQLGAGLSSSAASHAADSAHQSATADNYFRQLGSAVPMASANLEDAIAKAKAKAAAKNELSDSELRTRLLGEGEMLRDQSLTDARHQHHVYQTQVEDAKAQLGAVDGELDKWRRNKKYVGDADHLLAVKKVLEAQLADAREKRAPITDSIKNPAGIEEYARQAGIDAGENPARVLGLIQAPKPSTQAAYGGQQSLEAAAQSAGINGKVLSRITKPSGPDDAATHWEAIQQNAADYLKRGVGWDAFYGDMKRGLKGHPRTLKLAAAYWAPIFQARG